MVFLYCLFPLLSVGVAHFGGRHEEERLQVMKVLLGGVYVVRNLSQRWGNRGGESLSDFLRRQACGRIGIEAEILLSLAGDEFGPALLAEYCTTASP